MDANSSSADSDFVLQDVPDLSRQVLSSQQLWSGAIFAVENDELVLAPGQSAINRQTVVHHNSVSILAWRDGSASSQVDGAPEILMIRQYRHPVRADLWEIPAGLLDIPNENPLQAARRELAEETDYAAEQWHVLVDSYASPGFTTEGCRIFLARQLQLVPVAQRSHREDEEAEFRPTWFRFADVLQAVLAGDLHSPSTVMGALAAAQHYSRLWQDLRAVAAPWMRSPHSL